MPHDDDLGAELQAIGDEILEPLKAQGFGREVARLLGWMTSLVAYIDGRDAGGSVEPLTIKELERELCAVGLNVFDVLADAGHQDEVRRVLAWLRRVCDEATPRRVALPIDAWLAPK